jgi:hypothetical protein
MQIYHAILLNNLVHFVIILYLFYSEIRQQAR